MSPTHAVLDGLMSHRSIRRFKNDPVPEGILRTILLAGEGGA